MTGTKGGPEKKKRRNFFEEVGSITLLMILFRHELI